MKKALFLAVLLVSVCFLTGCGFDLNPFSSGSGDSTDSTYKQQAVSAVSPTKTLATPFLVKLKPPTLTQVLSQEQEPPTQAAATVQTAMEMPAQAPTQITLSESTETPVQTTVTPAEIAQPTILTIPTPPMPNTATVRMQLTGIVPNEPVKEDTASVKILLKGIVPNEPVETNTTSVKISLSGIVPNESPTAPPPTPATIGTATKVSFRLIFPGDPGSYGK